MKCRRCRRSRSGSCRPMGRRRNPAATARGQKAGRLIPTTRRRRMAKHRRWRADQERGAVLVHTAIAMLTLMAFSALVIDYGAFWVSRGQAQNSADAAALAGAVSLAFDDPDDVPRAQSAAAATGAANLVWGAPPSILPATDVLLVP